MLNKNATMVELRAVERRVVFTSGLNGMECTGIDVDCLWIDGCAGHLL